MTSKKYEDKLHVEMTFAEALGRFAGTDQNELPELAIKKKKKLKKVEDKRRPSSKDD